MSDEPAPHHLLVFEGTSGVLRRSCLRTGNECDTASLRSLPHSIVGRPQAGHTAHRLPLRADGGFCKADVLDHAEAPPLHYAIRLSRNSVFEAHVKRVCARTQEWFTRHDQLVRRVRAFSYDAESRARVHPVRTAIEVTVLGLSVRFVVGNQRRMPAEISAWHNMRRQA